MMLFKKLPVLLLTLCAPAALFAETAPSSEPPEGMVKIPGGVFRMGGDAGLMEGDSQSHRTAYLIHEVEVDAFWMDETEVTNRQFAEFVEATGPNSTWLKARGLPTTVRVTRGGSFLCSDQYCSGYKPGSRQTLEADSPASHTGFRCVEDLPTDPPKAPKN